MFCAGGRFLDEEIARVEAEERLIGANRIAHAKMHLVERLTRVDADTLLYEFTVDDANTWTRPWTAAVPMKRVDTPIYEYACHEGNYAMRNILSGARAQEKR